MDELLAWYEEQLAVLHKLIEGMQQGRIQILENQVDDTQNHLVEFQRQLTELEKIVSNYRDRR